MVYIASPDGFDVASNIIANSLREERFNTLKSARRLESCDLHQAGIRGCSPSLRRLWGLVRQGLDLVRPKVL